MSDTPGAQTEGDHQIVWLGLFALCESEPGGGGGTWIDRSSCHTHETMVTILIQNKKKSGRFKRPTVHHRSPRLEILDEDDLGH